MVGNREIFMRLNESWDYDELHDDVLKLHENKSLGQFRGENEVHELFSSFPPKWTLELLLPRISKWPLNQLVFACRSFKWFLR